MVNWQRIEPWIKSYGSSENSVVDRGFSEQELSAYEEWLGYKFPNDFKEFHQKFRQDQCWRIGRWVLLPLEDALEETGCMAEIMIRDDVYGDFDQYWNREWLVIARNKVNSKKLMGLNLDSDTDLEPIECMFSQLNEVFKFENKDGYICPLGVGFGKWLEKLAIRLEKRNHNRRSRHNDNDNPDAAD